MLDPVDCKSKVITGACVIRRSRGPVPLPAGGAVRVAGVLTLSDVKIRPPAPGAAVRRIETHFRPTHDGDRVPV